VLASCRAGRRFSCEAGTYTVPLPAEAARQGRVAVRVVVDERGVTRAATGGEVEDVSLVYVPVSR
jgi:hypothetical protein